MTVPSASRANKAGDRIRRAYEASEVPLVGDFDLAEELSVLGEWRKQFGAPMAGTGMTLRSAVRTCGHEPNGRVVQRHKREEQIIAKLVRSKTRLSKMEDIAGCRAVLPTLADVHAVAERIRSHARSLEVVSEDDYIVRPRPGGYRALHMHVVRDGCAVEVQLRTVRQHRWAESVETWDGATGHDIKHEQGPPEVRDAFRHAAEALSEADHGSPNSIWASLNRERATEMLQRWISRGGGTDE